MGHGGFVLLTGSCRSGFYSICCKAKGLVMVSVNCYSQVPTISLCAAWADMMENIQHAPLP